MLDEKDNVSVLEEDIDADDGIVQLINEDGEALDFFFVASLEYKGSWYAFFQPAEEMEDIDEDEVAVFRVVEGDDGDTFEPVEDEQLLNEVYDEYVEMHKQYLKEKGCDLDADDCCCCGHDHHDDCGCGEHDCDCEGDCDCDHDHDCGEDHDCDCGCHKH